MGGNGYPEGVYGERDDEHGGRVDDHATSAPPGAFIACALDGDGNQITLPPDAEASIVAAVARMFEERHGNGGAS